MEIKNAILKISGNSLLIYGRKYENNNVVEEQEPCGVLDLTKVGNEICLYRSRIFAPNVGEAYTVRKNFHEYKKTGINAHEITDAGHVKATVKYTKGNHAVVDFSTYSRNATHPFEWQDLAITFKGNE